MTKCEAYWHKVEEFQAMDDLEKSRVEHSGFEPFCKWCCKDSRTMIDDWEIAKLRNKSGIPLTTAEVFKPLIRKRNEFIRDLVVERLKTRLNSDSPKDSKVSGTIVKRMVKDTWRQIHNQDAEYQNVEVKDFLIETPYLKSLVTYKTRGSFGDAYFPGNASGFLLVELIHHFKPQTVFDPMEGSGTSRDVCKAMDLKYIGNDLKNQDGYDLAEVNIDLIPQNDFTFFHPPYWDLIKYSDNPEDLSNTPSWDIFEQKLESCVRKLLMRTKILAVLIGDVPKEGRYYSALPLLLSFDDRVHAVLIKELFSVLGIKGFYDAMEQGRIPVRHEYVVLLRGDLYG